MDNIEPMEKSDHLFHYTSMDVLCNMLNAYRRDKTTGCLNFWASNIFTMNDPREMKHGKDLLEILLPVLESLFHLPPENRLDLKSLDTEKILKDAQNAPFIVSFTANDDDISMWNLYGDNGRGISLVFSKDLKPYPLKDVNYSNIIKVNYKKGIDDYPNLADIYNNGIKEWRSFQEPEKIKECKERTLGKLYTHLCPYIKSEAYNNENEYRICYTGIPSDKVFFRVKNNCLIPYIEVPIPIQYLEGILLGPCCCHELAKQSLRYLLDCCKLDIEIMKSNVPYRKI